MGYKIVIKIARVRCIPELRLTIVEDDPCTVGSKVWLEFDAPNKFLALRVSGAMTLIMNIVHNITNDDEHIF